MERLKSGVIGGEGKGRMEPSSEVTVDTRLSANAESPCGTDLGSSKENPKPESPPTARKSRECWCVTRWVLLRSLWKPRGANEAVEVELGLNLRKLSRCDSMLSANTRSGELKRRKVSFLGHYQQPGYGFLSFHKRFDQFQNGTAHGTSSLMPFLVLKLEGEVPLVRLRWSSDYGQTLSRFAVEERE